MPYYPPHQLDVALANVGAEAPTAERMEVIWGYYERSTGESIGRTPTESERQAVHTWLMSLRRFVPSPRLSTWRGLLRVDAAMSIKEKASSVVQLACPTCVIRDDARPLARKLSVQVNP